MRNIYKELNKIKKRIFGLDARITNTIDTIAEESKGQPIRGGNSWLASQCIKDNNRITEAINDTLQLCNQIDDNECRELVYEHLNYLYGLLNDRNRQSVKILLAPILPASGTIVPRPKLIP